MMIAAAVAAVAAIGTLIYFLSKDQGADDTFDNPDHWGAQ